METHVDLYSNSRNETRRQGESGEVKTLMI